MKYQLVRQHSLEDCGSAGLASVANYHGKTLITEMGLSQVVITTTSVAFYKS